MSHLRSIASIVLLLLLTNCSNQRSEKIRDRDYTSAELIGKWIEVSADASPVDAKLKIGFIQLINDSVAEIQIHDLTGVRKIVGEWERGFKKEIKIIEPIDFRMNFKSDIKISFNPTDNKHCVFVLKLGEENKKIIMTTHGYKFEKE